MSSLASSFSLRVVVHLLLTTAGPIVVDRPPPTTPDWEPLDADREPVMLAHRRETARFASLVAGGFPAFRAQSYRDLWAAWQQTARPAWLKDHTDNLRARYGVCLGNRAKPGERPISA
jgi:hypothetical protein